MIVFEFDVDNEGWQYFSPPEFATPSERVEESELRVSTTDNTNSYGFWESPMFQIANGPVDPSRGVIIIGGTTGLNSIFRSTFMVSTDVADQSQVPTIRLRSSSADFQQSDVLVATSTGAGTFSPQTTDTEYVQYFSQPEGQDMFRLDFDVLNFLSDNAANATMGLDRVVVEALETEVLGTETSVVSFDFTGGVTEGFTSRTAPGLTEPIFETPNEGLLIRGATPVEARGKIPSGILDATFGYWGLETTAPFAADTLYRVEYTVVSEATAGQRDQLAAFRLRVNDSSLMSSAYINIESMNDASRVPLAGSPETYYLYFQTPSAIVGNTWIFSFDYLYVPTTDNDPTLGVILQGINVVSYDIPTQQ